MTLERLSARRDVALPAAITIVIDTDIGADPDDALALCLALASPEVALRGVTIVSGDVEWRGRIAARLLGLAARPDIPVVTGLGDAALMSGAEGVGILDQPYNGPAARIDPAPAVDWLLAASRRRPFHLVAIGPLTNVAAAIKRDPGFARRLLGLTVMGGLLDTATMPAAWQRAIRELGAAGWPDYNTMCDPAAALTVAACGIPVTWVPLDVTMRVPLRRAARNRLPEDHPLGAALGHAIDAWWASWFPSALPPPSDPAPIPPDAVAVLHDPLAVATLFAGDWLRVRPAHLTAAIEDGVFRLRERDDGIPARVAAAVDDAAFEQLVVNRLLTLMASRPA
jgi:purine nucleosidase